MSDSNNGVEEEHNNENDCNSRDLTPHFDSTNSVVTNFNDSQPDCFQKVVQMLNLEETRIDSVIDLLESMHHHGRKLITKIPGPCLENPQVKNVIGLMEDLTKRLDDLRNCFNTLKECFSSVISDFSTNPRNACIDDIERLLSYKQKYMENVDMVQNNFNSTVDLIRTSVDFSLANIEKLLTNDIRLDQPDCSNSDTNFKSSNHQNSSGAKSEIASQKLERIIDQMSKPEFGFRSLASTSHKSSGGFTSKILENLVNEPLTDEDKDRDENEVHPTPCDIPENISDTCLTNNLEEQLENLRRKRDDIQSRLLLLKNQQNLSQDSQIDPVFDSNIRNEEKVGSSSVAELVSNSVQIQTSLFVPASNELQQLQTRVQHLEFLRQTLLDNLVYLNEGANNALSVSAPRESNQLEERFANRPEESVEDRNGVLNDTKRIKIFNQPIKDRLIETFLINNNVNQINEILRTNLELNPDNVSNLPKQNKTEDSDLLNLNSNDASNIKNFNSPQHLSNSKSSKIGNKIRTKSSNHNRKNKDRQHTNSQSLKPQKTSKNKLASSTSKNTASCSNHERYFITANSNNECTSDSDFSQNSLSDLPHSSDQSDKSSLSNSKTLNNNHDYNYGCVQNLRQNVCQYCANAHNSDHQSRNQRTFNLTSKYSTKSIIKLQKSLVKCKTRCSFLEQRQTCLEHQVSQLQQHLNFLDIKSKLTSPVPCLQHGLQQSQFSDSASNTQPALDSCSQFISSNSQVHQQQQSNLNNLQTQFLLMHQQLQRQMEQLFSGSNNFYSVDSFANASIPSPIINSAAINSTNVNITSMRDSSVCCRCVGDSQSMNSTINHSNIYSPMAQIPNKSCNFASCCHNGDSN